MENTSNYGLKRWDRGGPHPGGRNSTTTGTRSTRPSRAARTRPAAALAAATALEQKMGLQHIQQRLNGTTGDCSIFASGVDWDQWTEVLFFLTPKLSGA